jgi:hypothetical protein
MARGASGIRKFKYIFNVLWVITVFLCVGAFYFSYYHPVQNTKADMIKQDLREEFDLIKPLSAQQTNFTVSGDATKATLKADYSAQQSYTEISRYYDTELKKHGWEFIEAKESNPLWGKPDGNKYIRYRKVVSKNFAGIKEYTASISYPVLTNKNGVYNFSFILHL